MLRRHSPCRYGCRDSIIVNLPFELQNREALSTLFNAGLSGENLTLKTSTSDEMLRE